MSEQERPLYQKRNSFVELRHRHDDALAAALARIARLRETKEHAGQLSEDSSEDPDRPYRDTDPGAG